ncbi:MAG: 2-polyprenylphenol hydroxylase [Ornithinimicrobium sp.]
MTSGETTNGNSGESRDEERYLVVKGRRWRRQDPAVPEDAAAALRSHLGRGRSAVGVAKRRDEDPAPHRRRVNLAKHGLGERGTPWWEQTAQQRQDRWQEALSELANLDHHSDGHDSDGHDGKSDGDGDGDGEGED